VPDDTVAFGERNLQVRATPGHTSGCLTYVLDDRSMAFTGDCLMIRGSGRTDFQQGDPGAMFHSVREQIFSLPDSCLLYPAHDYRGLTVTSVGEECRFNPRLGGEVGEGDFTGYMKNLRLAHPKKIDVAVPANLKCGRPETDPVATEVQPGRRSNIPLPGSGRSIRTASKSMPTKFRSSMFASLANSRARSGIFAVRNSYRSRRAGARPAGRCGMPRRQPLGPSHRDPARGRVCRCRQSRRRDAVLARRRPRRRRWQRLAQCFSPPWKFHCYSIVRPP